MFDGTFTFRRGRDHPAPVVEHLAIRSGLARDWRIRNAIDPDQFCDRFAIAGYADLASVIREVIDERFSLWPELGNVDIDRHDVILEPLSLLFNFLTPPPRAFARASAPRRGYLRMRWRRLQPATRS